MSIGVHHLHHEEVDTGTYLAATHQKEEQFLLKSQASLVKYQSMILQVT